MINTHYYVFKENYKILKWAAENGNPDVLSFMIDKMANSEDFKCLQYGYLDRACDEQLPNLVKSLLTKIDYLSENYNLTLYCGIKKCMNTCPSPDLNEIIDLLINKYDFKQENNFNTRILLIDAVNDSDISLVKFLIQKGADVNKQNNHGNTALLVACFNNDLKIVQLLIDSGATPDIRNNAGMAATDFANIRSPVADIFQKHIFKLSSVDNTCNN